MKAVENVQLLPPALFDDLCNVVIYNYADMRHRQGSERSASVKRLIRAGVMSDRDDAAGAYDAYRDQVIRYALDHMPNGCYVGYDYWGAMCILRPGDNTQNKDLPFAGSECWNIMWFLNHASLVSYTTRQVAIAQEMIGC